MKILSCILIVLLITIKIFSQSGWVLQHSGTSNLTAVLFYNAKIGVVLGENGTILHTTNGGIIWEKQSSGTNYNLNYLSFLDSNKIIVVGNGGNILQTSNGGSTWLNTWRDTTTNFSGVSFFNNKVGIIAGNQGTTGLIISTSNGGITWDTLSSKEYNFIPKYVYHQDSTHVIISGVNMELVSSDGGKTWVNPSGGIGTDLRSSISFSGQTGIRVGTYHITSQNLVWYEKTTDGGLTWVGPTFPEIDHFYVQGVDCITPNFFAMVGSEGNIFCSSNNGATWEKQSNPTSNWLNDIYFSDDLNGTAVGNRGTIIHTTTGGIANSDSNNSNKIEVEWTIPWNYNFDYSSIHPLKSAHFIDNNIAFVAGEDFGGGGIILKTTDKGKEWSTSYSSIVIKEFTDIAFVNKSFGIVVGHNNIMLSTTDGGSNWVDHSISGDLESVSLVDTSIGTAVGANGLILHTIDGGKNWIRQNSGTNNHLIKVDMVNAETGYAVGYNGTIISTTDGGQIWIKQNSGYSDDLLGVCFTNEKEGTVVGCHGTILHTTNGGINWDTRYRATLNTPVLYDVSFADDYNGIAVGSSGIIFCTTDGGNSWVRENTNTNVDLRGVAVRDSIVISIGDGYIFRYDKWGIKTDTVSTDSTSADSTAAENPWAINNNSTSNKLTKICFMNDILNHIFVFLVKILLMQDVNH